MNLFKSSAEMGDFSICKYNSILPEIAYQHFLRTFSKIQEKFRKVAGILLYQKYVISTLLHAILFFKHRNSESWITFAAQPIEERAALTANLQDFY